MNTKSRRTPKTVIKSLKLDDADEAAIKAAVERWSWRSEADIMRTALRVGLLSLSKDESPLGQPPLDPNDISPPRDLAAGLEESDPEAAAILKRRRASRKGPPPAK